MTDREVAEINVLRAVVRQADAIGVLQAKLDAITAERDALQDKLDAVPIEAIKYFFGYSVMTNRIDWRSAEGEHYGQAQHQISKWLEQVQS